MPLSDYFVHERVGSGAQGVVYRAVRKLTGETVAIKQIDVSHLGEADRANVLREVKVLASLSADPHPNVMLYRESFVESPHLNIVLQWSSGGTLQDAYNEVKNSGGSRKMSEIEIWNYFLSIVLALDHIHARNTLHRDCKLANVFLHFDADQGGKRPAGDRLPLVRLGDFGVSCVLDDRSRAQTMVGTPYFISPELCCGKKYTSKSDIWSVGVLLFVLLNNKMPFDASNYAALILRIVQAEHVKQQVTFSPFLHRLATWCMQKNEQSRPTARQILEQPECAAAALKLKLHLPADLKLPRSALPAPRFGGGVGVGVRASAPERMAPFTAGSSKRAQQKQRDDPAAVLPEERPLPLLRAGAAAGARGAGCLPSRRVRNRHMMQGASTVVVVGGGGGGGQAGSPLPHHRHHHQQRQPSRGAPTALHRGARPALVPAVAAPRRAPERPQSASTTDEAPHRRRPPPRRDINDVISLPTYDIDGSSSSSSSSSGGGGGGGGDERAGSPNVAAQPPPARPSSSERYREHLHHHIAGGALASSPSAAAAVAIPSAQTIDFLHRLSVDDPAALHGEEDLPCGAAGPSVTWRVDDEFGESGVVVGPASTGPAASPVAATWRAGAIGNSVVDIQLDTLTEEGAGADDTGSSSRCGATQHDIPEEIAAAAAAAEEAGSDDGEGDTISCERNVLEENAFGFAQHSCTSTVFSNSVVTAAEGGASGTGTTFQIVHAGEGGDGGGGEGGATTDFGWAGEGPADANGTGGGFDVSATPLEQLSSPEELAAQVEVLVDEGERLIGPAAFAELIDALTCDAPLQGRELQRFVEARVPPASSVADVMYVGFRYLYLLGELRRLRGTHS